eukprot:128858-Amphidinium_carterae.1
MCIRDRVKIQVEETEIPKPKPGEVLVRVAAAPVNPSDYGVWKRHVGPPKGIGCRNGSPAQTSMMLM